MNTNSSFTTSSSSNDECVLTDEDINRSYNLTFHVISIFVLLIVSFLGASLSVVSTRVKCLHISPVVINTGKFFGSGVVLATGFIHMLPTGMKTLTDPCLPDSWNVYGAYAGLFAMLAALVMQLIEFIAHQRYRSIKSVKAHSTSNDKPKKKEQANINVSIVEVTTIPVEIGEPTHHHHHHGASFQDDIENHKISTYLLEFGVALHSILIGLTLGTTTESFIALFIALSCHQFFEAIALGAQIARLDRISLRSVISMIVFFALTTPIGISIGIGIHSKTYNPKSIAALLVNGILDSISAGILIYVALINLISAEMGVGAHAFHSLSRRLKLLYFLALYAGVAAMAVIGRWA